jgi:hypothetical protein
MNFKITIPKRNTDNGIKHYFYVKYGDSTYSLARLRGTFDWRVARKNYCKHYMLQFSLKDPWWKPRAGIVNNGNLKLCGWLFFYVGWSIKQTR